MAFHVSCPITCRRICYCKLGFQPELQNKKSLDEFVEAAARIEAIFNNPSLIYEKQKTVEVLVPKVAVMPPPVAPQAIGAPDVVVDVDVDVAEELSAQNKRVAMQKKAAAASVVAEDYVRRFESGDVAVGLTKDDGGDELSLSNAKVMCRLCFSGENEESERAKKMISCKNCNKKYHKGCVKSWAQNRDLFHWSSWTCPSCRSCEVCRKTGDPNKLMFCKRCDGAYHCYCQHPPHKNVSSGPYLCPKHTKCHSCASTVPGNGLSVRWFLGYTCCDACGRLFVKGNYCPVCLKVYRDSESTPMVCCDICQRWVHCRCDGISDEKYLQFQVDNNLQYRCATCRGECYQVRDLEDAVQELWRRRDKADRELTARLRAAAGLPTQEEIFSIQLYSDDEDNKPLTKNEHGRSLKFSLKAPVDKSPKKKSASKKYGKKKGFNSPLFGRAETRAHGQSDAHSRGFITSDNNKDESGESEIAGSLTNAVWSNNDVTRNNASQKITDKSLNTKGPKLVIHLGTRNKNVSNLGPENESRRSQPAMCGILAVFGCVDCSQSKRARIIELSRRLRHRGPDWSGLHSEDDCYLAHQRLAIVDPASGDQPLYNEDKTIIVTVNGEIYNHKALKEQLKSHNFNTGSDCEVIAHLYEEYGEDFVHMLDGMFSFVLLDTRHKTYMAARDAIGITPLYMGWGLDGSVWFASEMKALSDDCEQFMTFLPGHIYSSKTGGLRRWYNPQWYSERIPSTPYDPLVLRQAFEKAVIKRLMTDVPFGVLLSGGLDSSLVAAVASHHLVDSEAYCQWGSQLHTFCIGLKGSPDLVAAREVADYLGTRHHEFYFTVQEGIDALEEVIYHIETYDVTTIRASTPMFLMSRKIKSLGVKMVLSGEGSDEIFGGYLYFHKAPNKEEFHEETCRKIKALHLYDCLRANKSTSAWGLEARVPFLDKDFIDVAMSIDPKWKMIQRDIGRIEKWVLRNAFDDDEKPYLPKHILYRQKEQFSDGVGYSWIDGLKDHANSQVTDSMLTNANFVYPENTPATKEAYYYRKIFEKFFPKNAARLTVPGGPSVACSTAKAVEWDASWSKNLDPSGRAALGVHTAAYENTK